MPATAITILVAEEDAAERAHLCSLLRKEGYSVIEAEDGQAASTALVEQPVDLACCSMTLAAGDQQRFLELAAQHPQCPPFLLLLPHDPLLAMPAIPPAVQGRVLGFLYKPFASTEVITITLDKTLDYLRLLRSDREMDMLVKQRTADLLSQNQSYEREIARRQQQEKTARNAVVEWRRTIDALPEMIAIIDDSRRFRRVNRPMLEFLGVSEQELENTLCTFCSQPAQCRMPEVMAHQERQSFELYIADQEKYLELDIIPYSAPDGEFHGSIHVFRDITKTKENDKEKELLQAKLLHAQKLESVGQLAAGIAHEINTPSQFVTSNVAFIDDAFSEIAQCFRELAAIAATGPIPPESFSAALETADWDYLCEEIPTAITQSKDGLSRISSIVRAMKEFSHPGSREKHPHDINHLIDITVTVARNEWKYAANVELDLAPDLPPVHCLSDELGQVLLNLLVNSAHAIQEKIGHTPEQEKGRIAITTHQEGSWIKITMEDDGCGVPLAIQKKIFDPFFTTKGVGKGTGQGLAIAYDVITNKHQGTLTFASTPGEGTTFVIRLPLTGTPDTTRKSG